MAAADIEQAQPGEVLAEVFPEEGLEALIDRVRCLPSALGVRGCDPIPGVEIRARHHGPNTDKIRGAAPLWGPARGVRSW